MSITTAELQNNLSKYLALSSEEDVYITENGRLVAKISNPNKSKEDLVYALYGSLPCDITPEEAREERLSKI